MKKLLLLIIAFAMLAVGAARAQTPDITGTWQGTLKVPTASLRIVIVITKADDGSLKAVLHSIDQGAGAIGANSIALHGSTVTISVVAIGGTYEGNLSADGNSMNGTWTQGPSSSPLTLTRATSDTAWTIPVAPAPLPPMAADADPSFEVATIKPTGPDTPGKGYRVNGRQFTTTNTTLTDLITFAYRIQPKQIIGAPDWLDKDKYDLHAQPDAPGQPSDKQWRRMLQKLLADRFQLTFHNQKQDMSVYVLAVAKNGPKLAVSTGDPNGLPGIGFRGPGDLGARNAGMGIFVEVLQTTVLDRPVVDQTGLTGKYDFTLKWTPDEAQLAMLGRAAASPPSPSTDPNAPPDLFTAIQEQLGLKLDTTKAPVDVLVIDHVEKPTAN